MAVALWTDRHRPASTTEVVGQPKAVAEAARWLEGWNPGKALFLHGPAGVGKTSIAEALAQERGLFLLRMNASDERGKDDIEALLSSSSRTQPLFHKGRLIVLDEVDGIPGTDRGAVPAMVRIIKESCFPVVLIANDPYLPKLRELRQHSAMVRLGRVHPASVEKRLKDIARKEGVELGPEVARNLARWSQGDLRSAINDLQTVALGRKAVTQKDMESLGYRERASGIFEILPAVFKSRSVNAGRKALRDADMDADDVFLWVENNVGQEFIPERLADAYGLLARADMFRSLVHKQQNWRFKAYMSDLIAGISVLKGDTHAPGGFRPYQPPERLVRMARTATRRAAMDQLCGKLGLLTHSSKRAVKRDHLPYLRIVLEARPDEGIEGLEREDVEAIAG
jgi:replication factor C large subunit